MRGQALRAIVLTAGLLETTLMSDPSQAAAITDTVDTAAIASYANYVCNRCLASVVTWSQLVVQIRTLINMGMLPRPVRCSSAILFWYSLN